MKLDKIVILAFLVMLLPVSAQADEAWNCKSDGWPGGVWRVEGNLLIAPPGDFGQPPGIPIVSNTGDTLVALSENVAPGFIDLWVIDKRAASMAIIHMTTAGKMLDLVNWVCTKQ